MQLDHNIQEDREKDVLETIKGLEDSVQLLAQKVKTDPLFFMDAIHYMRLARKNTLAYLKETAEFTGDKSELDDRELKLRDLACITTYFDNARKNIAQDMAGHDDLPDLFRAAVKRCDASIAAATAQVNETVKTGKYVIAFQKAHLGSAAEAPVKPQAPRPAWMKLVVDNTQTQSHDFH